MKLLAIWTLTSILALTRFVAAEETATPSAVDSTEQAPTPEQVDEAAKRYAEGVEAYKEERFKDAIDLFLESDQLAPSPALSFNIARAYDKIQDTAGSLKYYRDYLRRSPGAEDREQVAALVAEREQRLLERGVQQLTVISEPRGATISIDGNPVGVTPWTGEIAPGEHVVGLQLDRYADSERRVQLAAEHAADVVVRLVPAQPAPVAPDPPPPAAPAPVEPPPAPAVERDSGLGIWPWVALGAGAITLGAAGSFELLRSGAEDDARNAESQVEFGEHYDEALRHQGTARVLAGVGAGFLVLSGVLFYLDLDAREAPVAVACDATGCEGSVMGVF